MRDLGIFVQMGSVDSLPFAPRSKCDPVTAATLGPAVVTALGGIINSMFGSSSQDSANRTNLEIAKMNADLQRETNEQNYKMFQEQNAWNEDMWNKQNEYNLPANQVQRLLDAGINPAAVFGNGSATPASSVQSQTAPQFNAPQVNAQVHPYQPNFGIGDAVNAYMQSELNNSLRKKYNAETAHTEALTQFEIGSMESRINSAQALAKRDDSLGELARMELQYIQDSYYWRIKQVKNDVELQSLSQDEMRQKIYGHKLANGLAEIQLSYAPKLNEAQLKQYYETVNQIRAQIGLINANKLLTDEQKLHEVEKRTGTIIENGLKGFNLQTQDAVKDFVVQDYKNNSYILQKEAENWVSGERFRRFSAVIPFATGYDTRKYK